MDVHEKMPLIFGVPGKDFFQTFKDKKSFVAELRPGLEGINVTAAALKDRGVRPFIICDNMMAFCMERGLVERVHIFYEKRAKDALTCRTGSLVAAIAAKAHRIPVFAHKSGGPGRPASLLKIKGMRVTKAGIKTLVPATEQVPVSFITQRSHG